MDRPIPETDGPIAATARSRGMAVATRNVRDFADVDLIDPWADAWELHSMEQPKTPTASTPGVFFKEWRAWKLEERAAAQEQSR